MLNQFFYMNLKTSFHVTENLLYIEIYCYLSLLGVADQLQTNYAADFRHILKVVFECNATTVDACLSGYRGNSDHDNHLNEASTDDINEGEEVEAIGSSPPTPCNPQSTQQGKKTTV